MNTPSPTVPPKSEIIFVERGINSTNSYSTSSPSETDSESEGTKVRKSFTLNETFDALEALNNLSQNRLPELEKKAEKYAKIREESIIEQQKTNELLTQLAKHVDNFQNRDEDIVALKASVN